MHEERTRTAVEIERCRALISSTQAEFTSLREGFRAKVLALPPDQLEEFRGYCLLFGQPLEAWAEIGDPLG